MLFPYLSNVFMGKSFQRLLFNISNNLKILPLPLGEMYVDNYDMYGLLWWQEVLEEHDRDLARASKTK